MDTNLKGTANVLRHFIPLMVKKNKNEKGGIMVNMSSGWGRYGAALVAPYCASKWAMLKDSPSLLLKSCLKEWKWWHSIQESSTLTCLLLAMVLPHLSINPQNHGFWRQPPRYSILQQQTMVLLSLFEITHLIF